MAKKILLLFVLVGFGIITSNFIYAGPTAPSNDEISVSVYPNPIVDGKLFVKSSKEIRTLEIYNILGKLILHLEPVPLQQEKLEINVDELEDGVYLINIVLTDANRYTEKLLLEK